MTSSKLEFYTNKIVTTAFCLFRSSFDPEEVLLMLLDL